MHDIHIRPGQDLQAALNSAPAGATVYLAEGEYRQKVMITVPELTIVGQGAGKTVIAWDDYAQKIHADGKEYNTFRTWTVAVCADGVTMRDLAIVNDALHPEVKGQEVALTVYGDDFAMADCVLSSTQDTLFVGPLPRDLIARYDGFLPDLLRQDRLLRQRFDRCRIEGTVDYIFGCGEATFTDCEIRNVYDARHIGYAAAPAHALEQTEGFLFRNCRFTCEAGVDTDSIYLARPWRDYGLARFVDCQYDRHIATVGFDKWNDTHRDETARFMEEPAVPGRVAWANRQAEA